MTKSKQDQLTYLKLFEGTVFHGVNSFISERYSRGLSKRTIQYYQDTLNQFCGWLKGMGVVNAEEITPEIIRQYLLTLESTGHNAGGIHAHYRSVKAFINWYWDEIEPKIKNPINKVKSPRVTIKPLTRCQY